jgi:serine/threonine protein kinase
MAELLLARDAEGNRVVIKKILPALASSEALVEAFVREAGLAARLRHPNIVDVLGTGVLEGAPYIAMEWLDGIDLRALTRKLSVLRSQLHPAQALTIAARIARALAYAHALRDRDGTLLAIVHRDVSPKNVFVTRAGGVKLLDFGVAKTYEVATRSGLVVGTPAYMAPEQVDGLRVDGRTDLFALGVVSWEMLTGRRLWDHDDVASTATAVREASVPPPSIHCRGITPEVDAIVLALLAKFPPARPANAGTVATTLDRLAREHGSRNPDFELAHVVSRYAAAASPG